MYVWMWRKPSGTRFRIEVDGNPGMMGYVGWTGREGEIDEKVYEQICTSTDEVEIETLHQDLWRSLEPSTPQ